jgi:AbrB family looped-hinge helix DNA binding protein
MRQNLIVSGRGQITLPVKVRKRLGVQSGGVVILEDKGNEVLLRPAAVIEAEAYSEADIVRWDKEDRLDPSERKKLVKRLRKQS